MKPETKANDLILKFFTFTDREFEYKYAINCALILCDEIIDLGYTNKTDFKVYDFYSKVKIELMKKENSIYYDLPKGK